MEACKNLVKFSLTPPSSLSTDSPTVDWSHIQGLFERAKSDVLVLLDCCAAASSAPRRGNAVMETIAACGFEGRAPPPGEHSFTTSLVEVLDDWKDTPAFSATMLHSEVLRVLMRRRKEKCRDGQRLEWRSTPVHINNFTHPRTIGIELCKRSLIDAENFSSNQSGQAIEDLLQATGSITSSTYLDLMSLSCDALEERLRNRHASEDKSTNDSPSHDSSGNDSNESNTTLQLPHMLVSIALDQDQPLPNAEACRRWLCSFPGLAKYVKVEGVYDSYSTVLVLSIPVVIWNMMPNDPACQPIAYVTSRNLASKFPGQDLAKSNSLTTPSQDSMATIRLLRSTSGGSGDDQSMMSIDLPSINEEQVSYFFFRSIFA